MVKILFSYGANQQIPTLWAARNPPHSQLWLGILLQSMETEPAKKAAGWEEETTKPQKTPQPNKTPKFHAVFTVLKTCNIKNYYNFLNSLCSQRAFSLSFYLQANGMCWHQLKKRNRYYSSFQISHYIFIVINNDVKTQKPAYSPPSCFQEFAQLSNYSNFTRPLKGSGRHT